MIFKCPECGARVRGEATGSIVACGRCKNPVVVPEPRAATRPSATRPLAEGLSPTPSPQAQADQPPVEAPHQAEPLPLDVRRVWRTAAFVVFILASAHVGLYMLLTMDARAGIEDIRAVYSRSDLEDARRPGITPEPGTSAFTAWSRSVALWDKAEAYRVHARQVMLLRTGLFVSFLVLLGVTGWALFGILTRRSSAGQDARRRA